MQNRIPIIFVVENWDRVSISQVSAAGRRRVAAQGLKNGMYGNPTQNEQKHQTRLKTRDCIGESNA